MDLHMGLEQRPGAPYFRITPVPGGRVEPAANVGVERLLNGLGGQNIGLPAGRPAYSRTKARDRCRWASRIANLFARESETDEEQEANHAGVTAIVNAIVHLNA